MRVLVSGAAGKMGREVLKAVSNAADMELVGGIDPSNQSIEGVTIYNTLEQGVAVVRPDVVVDFTSPDAVNGNLDFCFRNRLPIIVGTTGLSEKEIIGWDEKARTNGWPVMIIPNFAIGAVLMMEFAREAAKYFDGAEIIEYHHEQKVDAPSGTAIKTAEMIRQAKEMENRAVSSVEKVPGARGGAIGAVQIHSVRLPGFVAHQEVIFGLPGQNLTIRHDSTHRESFMPGVLLAIRNISSTKGLVYGLEHILFS